MSLNGQHSAKAQRPADRGEQAQGDKKRIRQLERELQPQRGRRWLSSSTAGLRRKSLNAYWGDDSEGEAGLLPVRQNYSSGSMKP